MKYKISKNNIIKLFILVVSIFTIAFSFTSAFLAPEIGEGSSTDVEIVSYTTDRLNFTEGSAISLSANPTNFGTGASNLSSTTTFSATLIANNDTKTASDTYNGFINISSNNYVYSYNSSTPELLLNITNPAGNAITSIEGLTYIEGKGFDITTKTGTYQFADDYAISTTNFTTGTTQNWSATVTLVALETDQSINEGKSISMDIILRHGIAQTVNSIGAIALNSSTGIPIQDYRIYGNTIQSEVPVEYSRIEYLQSTGTQYINTNYSPSNNTKMWLDYQPTQAQSTMYAGARNTTASDWRQNYYFTINSGSSNTKMFAAFYNSANIEIDSMNTNRSQTQIGPDGIYYNNVEKYTPSSGTWQLNEKIILFGVNQNGSTINLLSKVKIYECKIWESDVLVMHLVPVYRKSDGVAGMYDTVSGSFFTNAGSGTFTAGGYVVTPSNPATISSVGDLVTDTNDTNYGKYKIPVTVTYGTNSHTTNIYLTEPLRKYGEYVDYIDYANGKVIRNVGEMIFDGSSDENWNVERVGSLTNFYINRGTLKRSIRGGLANSHGVGTYNVSNVGATTILTNLINYAYTTDASYTVEQLKTTLSSSNMHIVAPLETPTEETISLPSVMTFKGNNTLTIGTDIKPSNVYVEYETTSN